MGIIGKKIIRLPEVDSTSEEARRQVKRGEGEGLVVISNSQSAGRGKPGSVWFSPPGNLYLSAVIKPHRNVDELMPLTLIGAIAGSSAIYQTSLIASLIKWPNDLLVRGKKIGGILVERIASGHLIIGIGINLNSDPGIFPEKIRGSATTLKHESKKQLDPSHFSQILIEELDARYLAYLSKF
jgi:BirA family biotin operon repressor/biotin-[acetyl-CoA-carboxylase] ligase